MRIVANFGHPKKLKKLESHSECIFGGILTNIKSVCAKKNPDHEISESELSCFKLFAR